MKCNKGNDLSKSYDRKNIRSLCDKFKATYLPGQIGIFIEFIGKNTFVSTSYEGCLSDEWKLGNGVRQGGITTGTLFNFYLNGFLTDLADLSLECEVNGNRVNIFCYADNTARLASTEYALQFMLDTLAHRLENLSPKINVEKSCNIVFKHITRRVIP